MVKKTKICEIVKNLDCRLKQLEQLLSYITIETDDNNNESIVFNDINITIKNDKNTITLGVIKKDD